jgi:hypothetical protein
MPLDDVLVREHRGGVYHLAFAKISAFFHNQPVAETELLSPHLNHAALHAVPVHLQTVSSRGRHIGDRHPDNGDPLRAGVDRSRFYGRQPFAHEAVQRRVSKAVSQHVRYGAPVWAAREHAERKALLVACRHGLSTPSRHHRDGRHHRNGSAGSVRPPRGLGGSSPTLPRST